MQVHVVCIESRSFLVFEGDNEMVFFQALARYNVEFMVGIGRDAYSFALAEGIAMEAAMTLVRPPKALVSISMSSTS